MRHVNRVLGVSIVMAGGVVAMVSCKHSNLKIQELAYNSDHVSDCCLKDMSWHQERIGYVASYYANQL